jgi:hypothetical protein
MHGALLHGTCMEQCALERMYGTNVGAACMEQCAWRSIHGTVHVKAILGRVCMQWVERVERYTCSTWNESMNTSGMLGAGYMELRVWNG